MQKRPITAELLLIFLLTQPLISTSAFATRLDTSRLAKPGGALPVHVRKSSTPSYRSSRSATPRLSQDDERKLKNALSGFTVIINRTPPSQARSKLILGRAKTYLALQQDRQLTGKSLQLDAFGRKLIDLAQRDARFVAQDRASNPSMRAQAQFLLGVAADALDQVNQAVSCFQQALRLDPSSPNVPWMGFYIAETDFENMKFRDAISYYKAYYPKFNARTRRLVSYKVAWAYINLNQIDEAQRQFTYLIQTGNKDDIAKDATKDLAFLMTKFRTEDQIITLTDQLFKEEQDRLAFLRMVYDQQEAAGITADHSKIFTLLLKREKDPIQRIKLQLRGLNAVSREYASADHFNAFLRIRESIQKASIEPGSKAFDEIKDRLDTETQRLMRAYVDTFSGKTKTPEKLTREQIATSLKTLFAFFDHYFPKSSIRPAVFSLWLDVCIDQKDWVCVSQTGLKIENEADLSSLASRAELQRLAALEELIKKDPAQYKSQLIEAASQFVQKHPDSRHWLTVAKRLVDLKVENHQEPETLDLLNRIFVKEPTQDNFYHLQWIRFSSKRYDDILADNRNQGLPGKPDPRLADIYREASLRVALRAKKDKNYSKYAAGIQRFLALSGDPKKKAVARRDYLSFLINHGKKDEAAQNLQSLPASDRCSSHYTDLIQGMCQTWIRSGAFQKVIDLIPANQCEKQPELTYLRFLASLGSSGKISFTELKSFPTERRDYLLGLIGLAKPSEAISYFKRFHPETDTETQIALLSLRLIQGDWDYYPSRSERSWLGRLPAGLVDDTTPTAVERRMARIRFPNSSTSEKRFASRLKSIVKEDPSIRDSVNATLEGKPAQVQLRILKAAQKMESTIAKTILASPIPKGLGAEQLVQYQSGLSALAKDYSTQASEYQKLIDVAQKVIDDATKKRDADIISRPTRKNWPWPDQLSDDRARGFKALLESGNFMGSLIATDFNRDDLLKDDEDYYRVRAGVLLYGDLSVVMQRYVFDELTANKQKDLIEEWRKRSK